MSQAHVISIITPHPGLKEKEFEGFLMGKVFPDLLVFQRNVRGTSHSLLKSKIEKGETQYLWMMELDLVGGDVDPGGNAMKKVYDVMNDKLKPYGTLSSPFTKVAPES